MNGLLLSFPLFCTTLLIGSYGHVIKANDEKSPVTLEEFLTGSFSTKSWNASWLSDTDLMYKCGDNICKFNLVEKESDVLLNGTILGSYNGASVSFSYDLELVLIEYNVSSVFRHSTTAQYTILVPKNNTAIDLHSKNQLQLVRLSSINGIAYVYERNIYFLPSVSESVAHQLTNAPANDTIYFGVPDWVYEEEVLGSGSAMWFSPDGKHLAYAEFNDNKLPDFRYFVYGEPGSLDDQYPKEVAIKYPKVGQPNPVVNVHLVNLESFETISLDLPKEADETVNDFILYDVTWISDKDISLIVSNRVQNRATLLACSLNGTCIEEAHYAEVNGWLDPLIPKFTKDGAKRLEILPQQEGADRFDHIVLTDRGTNVSERLTFGPRIVNTIYGFNEDAGLIYYGGSVNDTPAQQHVFVVNAITKEDNCITCNFSAPIDDCKYAAADFSTDLSFYAKICRGRGPHFIEIVKTNNDSDRLIWEDNSVLRSKLAAKQLPAVKDLRVPLSDGFEARVRLLLPPNLNENANKKYPAIVYVYAGPNSNGISDVYSSGVQNYLVTSREYIYIYIDGRGSGRDGKNKMFQVYRHLGTVEIEDQLTVIKYLQQNLAYIDAEKTGIWGWSYGGFSAVWALAKDDEKLVKFALSVAPVTNFIYYDTIYTERYMGLPTDEDNLLGYQGTDVTRVVEKLRGKSYMLIHGNADDNVHYQQAMLLSKALELADIPFRQQSYPDENHSLSHVSRHLYHTLDQFFAYNFQNSTTK